MTKIITKSMCILLIAMLMIMGVTPVMAEPAPATPVNPNATIQGGKENGGSATSSGGGYLDPDTIKAGDQAGVAGTFQNIAGAILTVVQVVGIAVAVIMLIVLAIKYISAAPNDKAEIKKHAVVYVVGAIVLFAATGILEIIKNFAGVVHV